MLLVLGGQSDPLVAAVCRQGRDSSGIVPVISCEEEELFEACPFVMETAGRQTRGYLQLGPKRIALTEIGGVLARLPRLWWPSQDFDLQDQMFVYHETAASWFALLSNLECPVVNRFGLGWWLHDLTYPAALRRSLSRALDIAASAAGEDMSPPNGRLQPSERGDDLQTASVYIAGSGVLPAPGCDSEVCRLLTCRAEALRVWQGETGISLCRLDFDTSASLLLRHVEAYPLVHGEAPGLVSALAAAILDGMREAERAAA